ncbi:uncharacterized protein LOC125757457 [Rhipicephalus sanguineus]|uniref:uncharacterized protein LOC125757457 n=1 Tax=Rhipicephalus sanguineus TaxID=34632 RepID=UPI0020C3122F|nr:uncharacterized protein LOC125757457 [Rhipicephalus sanguineus]
MPQDMLMKVVDEAIDNHGAVRFQNECGMSVEGFLELLRTYLLPSIVEFEGSLYRQKQGICIGCCLAPVLSDLLMAHFDRQLQKKLGDFTVVRVFRYVDDYLVLFQAEENSIEARSRQLLHLFEATLDGLTLTMELPTQQRLRFLDLELTFGREHVCWAYSPRSKKALLPFTSGHSKLVKRGIAVSALRNALQRSCHHKIQDSFVTQTERLNAAGFPSHMLCELATMLLRKKRTDAAEKDKVQETRPKTAVIPYIHGVSHRIKKNAGRVGVRVVFSAQNKLGAMCRQVNSREHRTPTCTKKHVTSFVECQRNVVYEIPLTCGLVYVGQTGRCLNERLREHKGTLKSGTGSNLALHCIKQCASAHCAPELEKTRALKRYGRKQEHEIKRYRSRMSVTVGQEQSGLPNNTTPQSNRRLQYSSASPPL